MGFFEDDNFTIKLQELAKRATQRERTPYQIKTIAIFLYLRYLGYKVSYEAIRKWIHSISKFLPEFYQSSNTAFIDETKIKKGKRFYRLWLAVDKKGKLLFSQLSAKANTKVAKLVLLNTRSKKVITDKAPWYKAASRELGIDWEHETFGKRNVVERAFMPIKKRMKGFF